MATDNVYDRAIVFPITQELTEAAWLLKPQPDEIDIFLRQFEHMWVENHGAPMPKGWDLACECVRQQSALGVYKPKDRPARQAQYGKAPALGRYGDDHGNRTWRCSIGAPHVKRKGVFSKW